MKYLSPKNIETIKLQSVDEKRPGKALFLISFLLKKDFQRDGYYKSDRFPMPRQFSRKEIVKILKNWKYLNNMFVLNNSVQPLKRILIDVAPTQHRHITGVTLYSKDAEIALTLQDKFRVRKIYFVKNNNLECAKRINVYIQFDVAPIRIDKTNFIYILHRDHIKSMKDLNEKALRNINLKTERKKVSIKKQIMEGYVSPLEG